MADKLDYKKTNPELYNPKGEPSLIKVPPMQFIAIEGQGDPNGEAFTQAVEVLYGLSYAIKMSPKKGRTPENYFEYVVPPLEGLWWLISEGNQTESSYQTSGRDHWRWEAMIRQPEFVVPAVFNWACGEVVKKNKAFIPSTAQLRLFDEGLCVQIMHTGPYKDEPVSLQKITDFMIGNNLTSRIPEGARHHEIYLSDPRKAEPAKMRTILRNPVRHKDE